MNFQRQSQRFDCLGVQLSRPVDSLGPQKYAILRNVRAYSDGTIHPRLGLSQPSPYMEAPVHSIKRFYDSSTGVVDEITGGGTKLYMGGVEIDSGFSGDPLSMVPHRPSNTPEAYVYIADSLKMRKVNGAREVFNIGIAPPNIPLTASLASPSYTTIEDFETLPNGWAIGGTAGALSLESRVNTTIAYILYDIGATGWASVSPTDLSSSIQSGCLLTLGGSEAKRVEGIYPAISSTTIGSISYDSGGTGLCTIQLTTPTYSLQRDSLVRVGASENVRVLDVIPGRDGITALRCSTLSTFAPGAAVEGLASFRMNLAGTFAIGATITSSAFQAAIATGIGHITKAGALDISFVGGRPILPEDEIHLSIKLDVNDRLVEGKVIFDIDPSADATRNYFYFPFRANDLTPAVSDTLTTLTTQQTTIQTTLIEGSYSQDLYNNLTRNHENDPYYYDGQFDSTLAGGDLYDPPIIEYPTTTTTTGSDQWTELKFKVGDLTRVGPDSSRTLANVTALRIQVNVSDAVVMDVDSLWIGGTFGLTSFAFPYVWTYRYKASQTGAISNPAPPMRSGLLVNRGAVELVPTLSLDPQVDTIEYFRRGGTLIEWRLVGTSSNSTSFIDSYPDAVVSGSFGLDEDNFQPFPVADSPRTGVCNVRGTEVERLSGDTFDPEWARGSEIVINGVPNSLYASPSSTDKLTLEEAQGTLTAVSFFLRSPTLMGQPMSSMWGPYSVGGSVFMFACKDGVLYFTKGNNPDSAPENNQIEVTSPQEPLVGGCVHDGQAYVFSTERMFRVIPTFGNAAIFEVQELSIGKGLMTPWALCVDEAIYFVSRDGLYMTNGSEVKSLTDEDLYPLFPHDGQAGVDTNGYAPPDFDSPQFIRLAAGDGFIKFTAKDTSLVPHTWVFDTRHKAWISHDIYSPFVVCHYWDEGGLDRSSIPTRERVGGTDGRVYTANRGSDDNGSELRCQVRTASLTFGENRSEKLFGDFTVDHVGVVSTLTPKVNNGATSMATTTVVQSGARGTSIVDLASGAGVQARDLALDLIFTDPNVVLYEWQPSWIPRPEDSKLRWTDFHNDGEPGAKFLQGMVLTANTKGSSRIVQVQGDGGVVIATLNVNHNGYVTKAYPGAGDSWEPGFTHMMRLVPTDLLDQWEVFDVKWVWDPAPEEAIKWQTQGTTHDFEDFHHARRIWLGVQSSSTITLLVTIDGTQYTYIIPSTGGVQKKIDVPLKAIKGKLFTYKFTSTLPFRLFARDTAVEVHGWGLGGPYVVKQPFGDLHRTLLSTGESLGARI